MNRRGKVKRGQERREGDDDEEEEGRCEERRRKTQRPGKVRRMTEMRGMARKGVER